MTVGKKSISLFLRSLHSQGVFELSRVRLAALPYFISQMYIAYCINVRGLGKSIVVIDLFKKLKYSNERSTKPRVEVFRGGKCQNDSSSNIT